MLPAIIATPAPPARGSFRENSECGEIFASGEGRAKRRAARARRGEARVAKTRRSRTQTQRGGRNTTRDARNLATLRVEGRKVECRSKHTPPPLQLALALTFNPNAFAATSSFRAPAEGRLRSRILLRSRAPSRRFDSPNPLANVESPGRALRALHGYCRASPPACFSTTLISSCLEWTPVLAYTRLICAHTVFSEMTSSSAMNLAERPRAR